MKKSFVIICITLFVGMVNGQQKELQVNKSTFTHLKQAYEKSDEAKITKRLMPNPEQRRIFENDMLGLFSLTPQSFNTKTAAICKCLLKNRKLKSNEVTMLNNFLTSVRLNNQSNIEKYYKEVISVKDASPLMAEMVKTINEDEQPTAQAGGRGWWRAVGVILGAAIGAGVGGSSTIGIGAAPGASIGALAGKEIADELYDQYYGVSSNTGTNVVATPDGGDCTSPVLRFPLF